MALSPKRFKMSPDELELILTTATAAARIAGAHMKANIGHEILHTKLNQNDLVTVVDKKCQELIEQHIQQQFPSHDFLGEEDVAPGSEASTAALDHAISKERSYLWIVDPIDGTTNFVHHRPASVVSIACAYEGKVLVGVIYDPYRDELFSSKYGGGAYCNGQRVSIAKETTAKEALIGYGIGTKDSVRLPMLRWLGEISAKCRGIRLQGSAALELAWVSCGRQTGFYELDLNSWDVAAGAILITEAGGKCTDSEGKAFTLRTRNIVVSNGAEEIHSTLLQTIQCANAVFPVL